GLSAGASGAYGGAGGQRGAARCPRSTSAPVPVLPEARRGFPGCCGPTIDSCTDSALLLPPLGGGDVADGARAGAEDPPIFAEGSSNEGAAAGEQLPRVGPVRHEGDAGKS